ncbi:hypothetical protein [Roseibium sp. MMSF_3412]|uniref:hypothetical protein n=1 Tax=Roseibium sp. MMSF_3412 TaxID=3046712 RepID=UPI00273E9D50|nr:hypothetical protein [Roseibium sp. MMSF_3412]
MKLSFNIREDLGEYEPSDNEAQLIDKIIEANDTMLPRGSGDERYKPGMRAQHPKAHATVEGTFEVLDLSDKESWAQVGLFGQTGTYPVKARFSNSASFEDNPEKGDAHGLAIRIEGPADIIRERKFVDAGSENSIDFVLMDNETFFEGDLEKYARINDLAAEVVNNKRNSKDWLASKINALKLALEVKFFDRDLGNAIEGSKDQFPDSPLTTAYFSTTPYLLGEHAVKYELRPYDVSEPAPQHPKKTDDYLSRQLFKGLSAKHQIFGFYVKRQQSRSKHPIEDPTIPWDGAEEILIARLKLSKIGVAKFEDWRQPTLDGENVGYNIWNTIQEHRPLGAINRARGIVYVALQKKRHELSLE